MKFNSWSKKRILEGKKTLTSRKEEHTVLGDTDVRAVFGPLPWWFIKTYLYRDEGAESPEELQRVINQIFRRHVKYDEMFYVHVLNLDTIIEAF